MMAAVDSAEQEYIELLASMSVWHSVVQIWTYPLNLLVGS